MKKTVLVLAVAIMVMGTMSVAFADASWGPLAILESLSEKSSTDILEMRDEDETLGDVAKELQVYDQFRAAALAGKTDMLNEMVESKELTQEKANEILTAFAECDGTMEQQRLLQETGLFGQGAGNGQGNGLRAMDGEGFGAKEGGNGGLGGGQMRRGGGN